MASSKKKKAATAAIERFLVEQAPPGQWAAVLADIQQLLPKDGALSTAEAERLAKAHWAQHGGLARREPLDRSNPSSVLLHALAESAAASTTAEGPAYLDPAINRIVTVDHRTGAVVAETDVPTLSTPPSTAAATAADRQAVADAVARYVASQYATEAQAASAVFPGGAGDADESVVLRVAVYAENINVRNYWAGSWLSLWEVARQEGGGLAISGSAKVRAHYFEEGNMQMQTTKAFPLSALDSALPLASVVVAAISSFESGLQRSLDATYAGLSGDALKVKALRRKLSLSKQRMEWSAALHRVSRSMANK